MKKSSILRYLVIIFGLIAALSWTVLPALYYTIIDPLEPYKGDFGVVLREIIPSLIGALMIFSPFLLFFVLSRGMLLNKILISAVPLVVITLAAFTYALIKGDPQLAIAYMLYVIPLQFICAFLLLTPKDTSSKSFADDKSKL